MFHHSKILAASIGVCVLGISFAANADETPIKAKKKNANAPAIVIDIKVKGRADRPQVVTDVSKITLERPLGELRQPFLSKVEKVIERAPF